MSINHSNILHASKKHCFSSTSKFSLNYLILHVLINKKKSFRIWNYNNIDADTVTIPYTNTFDFRLDAMSLLKFCKCIEQFMKRIKVQKQSGLFHNWTNFQEELCFKFIKASYKISCNLHLIWKTMTDIFFLIIEHQEELELGQLYPNFVDDL